MLRAWKLPAEIFKDVKVPAKKPEAGKDTNGNTEIDTTTLMVIYKILFIIPKAHNIQVIVDEASQKYAQEWKERRNEDESASHFRVDTAREQLESVLAGLRRPQAPVLQIDQDGDAVTVVDGEARQNGENAEVVTIPLSAEDELSDIPAEMRETVASEIAAFRDRSNRRDLERLRKEEELEAAERRGGRMNRLASPPPSAPSGPAGGANGIPVGPRDRGVQGAPSGPKGYQGVQIPKDYQAGVSFVNGGGSSASSWMTREEEEDPASDEELERRRKERKDADLEKIYLDHERRWLNRERTRTAALEREKNRDKEEEASQTQESEVVGKRLKEWNDDVEASRKIEEYYQDRILWVRNRTAFRAIEAGADDRDRALEDREKARDSERREHARGMADSFLDRQAEELGSRVQAPREPGRFKMSLGAAAIQKAAAAAPKRTVAEVEGLLEDEEDAAGTTTKRTLVPIKLDTAAEAAGSYR